MFTRFVPGIVVIKEFKTRHLKEREDGTEKWHIGFSSKKLCFEISGIPHSRSLALEFVGDRINEVENSRFQQTISFASAVELQNVTSHLDILRKAHKSSAAISLNMRLGKSEETILSTITIFSLEQESGLSFAGPEMGD